MTHPDLGQLNAASEAAAVEALAPLFEGAPLFLSRLVAARPFSTWEALFARAREIAHGLPEAGQIELVDAHPRLGAPPAAVSALSFREQGYDRDAAADAAQAAEADAAAAGAAPASEDEAEAAPATPTQAGAVEVEQRRVANELERLNAVYEAQFGFRYCVFVAGRPRAALLPDLEAACWKDRDAELHRALDAVVDIAAARQAVFAATP